MKHEIIKNIIKDVKGKNYLEVGYGNGDNFKQMSPSLNKIAVDPNLRDKKENLIKNTSDEFFESNEMDFDVIFIDGDHTAEQVRKDITNSLRTNPKAIILHDTIPHDENMQKVPREQKQWTGDVWRAVVGFKESYPDIKMETYRSDYGLTVIYPEGKKVRKHFENMEMTFSDFKKNEVELLNIID